MFTSVEVHRTVQMPWLWPRSSEVNDWIPQNYGTSAGKENRHFTGDDTRVIGEILVVTDQSSDRDSSVKLSKWLTCTGILESPREKN